MRNRLLLVMNQAPEDLSGAAESFLQHKLSMRHLRVLLALSETGSLVAAADRLGVSQPAVSKTLAELEIGLGVTLHARRGRNNSAPSVAARLLLLARRLDAELQRAGDELRSHAQATLGELRVGATNAALADLLPTALAGVKEKFPNLTLAVHTHARTQMLTELRDGHLDLVVSRVPERGRPHDLRAHTLCTTRQSVVMSPHHSLVRTRQPSWDDLARHAWVWPLPDTDARTQQDRLWQGRGHVLPACRIETGDLGLIFALFKAMPLLALVPEHSARAAALAGQARIVPLDVPSGRKDLVAWHRPDDDNPFLAELVRHLGLAARSQG
jgi:DNA-binding transcriptional LysR family regulator